MQYQDLIIEKKGVICIVKLNRAKSLNAIIPSMFQELNTLMQELEKDSKTKVIIITGEGKAFAAGADITYMNKLNAKEAKKFAEDATAILRKMEEIPQVFIAAVNGYALGGGCELSLACDFRIAATNAKFGFPETSLGIIPGWSGTQRLPRLVGLARAKEMILTCEKIDAIEAYRIGLVNQVVESEELMEKAMNFAEKIARNSSVAVGYAKEAVNRGIQMDLDSAIDYENNLFGLCFATEDQKEGLTAFEEKRKPNFKGK